MTGKPVLPPQISALPVCPVRGLPIPYMAAQDEDGRANFALVDPARTAEAARYSLCGVCGQPLGYWKAFLGGPRSADPDQGVYSDPPMHQDCAEASLRLCPYIARPKVPRRSDPLALKGVATEPEGFIAAKPMTGWVMVIARQVRMFQRPAKDGSQVWLFRPVGGLRSVRTFGYQGGHLVETTEGP